MQDPIFDFILSNDLLTEPVRSPNAQAELGETAQLGAQVKIGLSRATRDYVPEVHEPGFFSNWAVGALDVGAVVGAGEFGAQEIGLAIDGINNDYDETYDIKSWFETDDERTNLVKEIIEKQTTDPAARAALASLVDSRNSKYADYILQRYSEAKLRRKEVEDAGLGGYITGAVSSILLDVVTAALITKGAGAAPAFGRGVAVLTGNVAARTAATARLAAAARLSLIGTAEGSIERMVQMMSDDNITVNDVYLAAGLGGVVGGLLGAAAPKMLGRVFSREALEQDEALRAEFMATRQALEDFEFPGGSLSAAAAPLDAAGTLGRALPGAGSRSIVARALPTWIRNPRNWIRDMGPRGVKRMEDHQLESTLNFWRFGNRIYKSAVNTAGEIEGTEARSLTVSEAMRDMEDGVRVIEEVLRRDYGSMLSDVYDIGKFRGWINNDIMIPRRIGRKFAGGAPRQEEFNYHADLLAEARLDDLKAGDGLTNHYENAVAMLRQNHLKDLTDEQWEKYLKHADAFSKKDDQFYLGWGNRGKAMGLLDPDEEILPGYRPQIWNRRALTENEALAKHYLYQILGNDPDENFVNEHFAHLAEVEGAATEGATVVRRVIDTEGGETFAEWAHANPEKANEVRRAWQEAKSEEAYAKLDEAAILAEDELKKQGADSLSSFTARANAQREKIVARLDRLEKTHGSLDQTTVSKATIKKLEDDILRAEEALGKVDTRLKLAQEATGDIEAIRALIGRRGSRAEKKAIKTAVKKEAKATNKAMKAYVKRYMDDAVTEIYNKLTDNKSAFGAIPDELMTNSKHFKHRQLDIKDVRNDPRFSQFLIRSSEHQRLSYINNYGRQTILREVFNPVLEKQGLYRNGDPVADWEPAMRKLALQPFSDDIEKARANGLPASVIKELQKEKTDATEFFDRAFGEITRSDYLNQTGTYGHVLGTVQAAVAATTLGNVFASVLGDTAMTALAGGRLGTGLGMMFRQRTVLQALKEIGEDDLETMLLLRGANVYDQGVAMARMDLDLPAFDVPGGKWSRVSRFTNDLASKEGWFNMLHAWNRFVRRSFGVHFAKEVTADMMGFNKLNDKMKRFYAKHGVDAEVAGRLAWALENHGRKLMKGKLIVPDTDKWLKAGLSKELKEYQRLVRGAGDEAMIDPGIGDRPFMRRHGWGRLLLQFQSFMYAAAERAFAPAWQSLVIGRGYDTQVYASVLLGMLMALAGEGIRAVRYGKEDEWLDEWKTGQGQYNLLKAAWLRSPFVYGMTGTAVDILGSETAPYVNNLFQEVTGTDFEIADARYTRFRQQQGIAAVVPAVGLVETARRGIVHPAMEGNWDKVEKTVGARLPLLNSLFIQTLAQMFEDSE